MHQKISLIVIVGPTASGKSDLGVALAKKYNGEIISADSRQAYRSLTIGTAKIKGVWKNCVYTADGIAHHCVDFVSPKKTFSASDFKECGAAAIADIARRGKTPIVVGGTGLWVDALVYDIELPHVPPNPLLRKELEKKSPTELFLFLTKIDPRRAAFIEKKNPRRLIRAIEIAQALGRVPALKKRNPYRALWIGITRDTAALHCAITRRSREMIRRGLIVETKKLLMARVSKKRIREFGFEYATALQRIEKKIPADTFPDILAAQTIQYAKRQMRWFGRNHEIHWVRTQGEAEKLARKFLGITFPYPFL